MIRLFGVSIAGSIVLLVVSETILLTLCFVAATYLTYGTGSDLYLLYDEGLVRVAVLVASVQLGLYFQDLYDDFRPSDRLILLQQVCTTLGGTFLFQALLGYTRSSLLMPRMVVIVGSLFVVISIPLWRNIYDHLVRKTLPGERILFLGVSPIVTEVVGHLLDRPELGLVAIGYLEAGLTESDGVRGVPLLGKPEEVTEVVRAAKPSRIVVGMVEGHGRLPVQQLMNLRFSGLLIEDAATIYETVFSRIFTRGLTASQLIYFGPNAWSVKVQTIYSIVVALIGVGIAFPIMAIVALLVRVSSPGPVLFRQKRVGLAGKTFLVYKFRSMYQDAEARTGAVWATKDDPRITPIGRWLRKLRLDELPQLFNVLRGEMSVVGPRPERPEFVTILTENIPFYSQRHCVRPGITGWAQINHKYGDSIDDTVRKLEYDFYYIKHLTPALDAYIMFHTIKVMLLSRGAQ